MPRDGRCVDREAELGHHFGGRALDGLAADDRRHRHDRRGAITQRRPDPRDREDRVDADKGVGRADHDGAQLRIGERGEDIGMRPGIGGAGEFEAVDNWGAAQSHKIILEIEPALAGM